MNREEFNPQVSSQRIRIVKLFQQISVVGYVNNQSNLVRRKKQELNSIDKLPKIDVINL